MEKQKKEENKKDKKEETLEEKYARVFDCDPSDEEVLASYDDKFNKEIDEI